MSSAPAYAALLLTVLVLGSAGCASRSVPDVPPKASAASTEAAETPRASVITALQADPPLPDPTAASAPVPVEPTPAPAHEGHDHHHHHHAPTGAEHAR